MLHGATQMFAHDKGVQDGGGRLWKGLPQSRRRREYRHLPTSKRLWEARGAALGGGAKRPPPEAGEPPATAETACAVHPGRGRSRRARTSAPIWSRRLGLVRRLLRGGRGRRHRRQRRVGFRMQGGDGGSPGGGGGTGGELVVAAVGMPREGRR